MRESTAENTFVVGLAVAGAVSAGAYSAGVLDSLFRALASHEGKFQRGEVDHRVVVKAMSGASAGSICTALAAVELVRGIVPAQGEGSGPHGMPMLHDLWVRRIRLRDEGGGDSADSLLGREDIADRVPAASFLDSSHIDRQARDLLKDVRVPEGRKPLGFIADDLDLFLTTTNLMGLPYEVRFGGNGDTGHSMASHSTVSHFRLRHVGAPQVRSHWLKSWGTDGITLDATGEATEGEGGNRLPFGDGSTWGTLLDTAVASAAFPLGLASRRLTPHLYWIESQAWAVEADPDMRPRLRGRAALNSGTSVPYIAVDGGVANNEPFELARYAIRKPLDPENMGEGAWRLAANKRGAGEADRAVIMIDPFPEGPDLKLASDDPGEQLREKSLLYAAKKLLPALIDHARFKPVELMNAIDGGIHSRFLIAPSRTAPEGAKLSGASAIASGFLGGFGGFFSEPFRQHDFELGQRNCRSFLEKYFVLSADNKVLAGAKGLSPSAAKDRVDEKGRSMVRIVEFDPGALPFFPEPTPFPMLGDRDLRTVIDLASSRGEKVARQLIWEFDLPWVLKLMIYLTWNGFFIGKGLKGRLGRMARASLLADLAARRQLEAVRELSDEDRALYVGLLRCGGKPAAIRDIAEKSTIIMSSGLTAPASGPSPFVQGQDRALFRLTEAETKRRLKADTVGAVRARGTSLWHLSRKDLGLIAKPVQGPVQNASV